MLKMITPEKALELVLANYLEPEVVNVPINESLGMSLAEDIRSDRHYPPFNRAMMDGYAVKADDAGKKVICQGIVPAGKESSLKVTVKNCLEIMTGAACPESADLVVPVEDVQVDGEMITLPEPLIAGANIAAGGYECDAGMVVVPKGEMVSPLTIANLACYGVENVAVYRKPRLALISTGDELAGPGDRVNAVQIRDSNGPMLRALASETGINEVQKFHAKDNLLSLKSILALTEDFDIVIFSGGVSMGKYDLVPRAVEESGAEMIFHKSTQKPGKPLLFAKRQKQVLFGLPGNPLASHMCFHRYISPIIRRMMGKSYVPVSMKGVITNPVARKGKRTFFQLVRVEKGTSGEYLLTPLKGKGSADIHTAALADAYIVLGNDRPALEKNDIVTFEFTGERRWQI